ncbi:hypothetical protein Tco_0124921 [Tanacetum coccineum]
MHEDFVATVYPQVHESLKLTTKEQVHLENPPSSSGTLSSMKNLDDIFTFGDQFLNEKSPKEELGEANMETEAESMVNVPIHQAFSSTPSLSTSVIDPSAPKPSLPPVQELIFTAYRVFALEKICANIVKKNKHQDQTTQALSSRVYMMENHNLYLKINKYVNEVIKETVHNALQAPIHDRLRDFSEFEMKEILHD